jgi:hypothetical protein
MSEQTNDARGHAEPSALAFSNGVRLSGRQWLGIGFLTIALVTGAPALWRQAERFEPGPDYRIPYELGNDYWLYARYSRLAAERYDTLVVGDSVVWGEYVRRGQTLCHYLNELAGGERFANLGLDGTYPAALAGLIEHYVDGVRDKNVILHCNLLWMSSPREDLQVYRPDQPVNHPRLLAQFWPQIPRYQEIVANRIGIVIEQHVPFCSWTNHLQQAYFDQKDVPSWTLEHPYDVPAFHGLPPTVRYEPISWTRRGIEKKDYDWVEPETSLQWRFFRHAAEVLKRRGNHVTIVVGPFNEHMLTAEGLRGYQRMHTHVVAWLEKQGLRHLEPAVLPSEEYADASHPLATGYARLARGIWSRTGR